MTAERAWYSGALAEQAPVNTIVSSAGAGAAGRSDAAKAVQTEWRL